MKINFRQAFTATLSALLLLSSAGAWAACEAEVEAAGEEKAKTTKYKAEAYDSIRQEHAKEKAACYVSPIGTYAWTRGTLQDPQAKQFHRNRLVGELNHWTGKAAYFRDAYYKFRACMSAEALRQFDAGCIPDGNRAASSIDNNQQQTQSSASARQDPQQRQQAQAAVQQAQSGARDAQSRAEASAQRAGRRTHDPAAEAHDCIQPSPVRDGHMFNGCDYTVNVVVCAIQPNEYTGAMNITDSFNCEALNRGGGGLWTPSAKSVIVGMNARSAKGGLAYFACKAPSSPADTTYVEGAGINARCR